MAVSEIIRNVLKSRFEAAAKAYMELLGDAVDFALKSGMEHHEVHGMAAEAIYKMTKPDEQSEVEAEFDVPPRMCATHPGNCDGNGIACSKLHPALVVPIDMSEIGHDSKGLIDVELEP